MKERSELSQQVGNAIHAAWKATELPAEEVFLRYRMEGGIEGLSTIKRWIYGRQVPNADKYDRLAAVLNAELGEKERLPRLGFHSGPEGGRVIPIINSDQGGTATSRFVSLKVA